MSDYGGEKPRVARLTGSNYRVWSLQVRLLLQSKELWRVVMEGPEESSIEAYSTSGRTGYPPGGYGDPRIGFGGVSGGLLEQVDVLGPGENTEETPEKKSGKGKDSKVPEVVDPSRSTRKNAEASELPTDKGQWEALRQIYAPVSAMNLASKSRQKP
ncbi:uncharacterized protein RSE6_06915 [Rhynchosporium secalis]|uniref:DUF4219 domain-containing protein n=1 Tax=Rhynchosporium secalis TaxID=38038 RepID=A0A1E1MBQ7_RHYSE|nr:uncharacterized protein RSE6_06915 [Rhynchosporium secalis]